MRGSVLETAADSGSPTRPVVLGVCSGPQAGRLLKLFGPKCYLGSGRLKDPRAGGSGVSCLILRGPRQTIVRRWSPSARLNGSRFDDAALNVGDRLQLAELDLEVLPPDDEQAIAAWRARISNPPASEPPDWQQRIAVREDELARRAAGIERTEFELHSRLEEHIQRSADLDARQSRLESSWAKLAERVSAAAEQEAANSSTRLELSNRAEELERARAELERVRGELERQQADTARAVTECDAARAEMERQRQAQHEERGRLESIKAELNASRHELQQLAAVQQQEARQQSLADELAARSVRLEAAEADYRRARETLEADRAQLTAEAQSLAAERQEWEAVQAQAAAATSAAEASAADRLASQAEIERRQAELSAGQQELEVLRGQFQEEQARLSAEHAQLAERTRIQTQQLEQERSELAQREALVATRFAEFEEQTSALDQRQQRLAADEQALFQRLDEARARDQQHQAEDARLADLRRTLATRQEEYASQSAALEAQRQEIARLRSDYEAARENLEREHEEFAAACSDRDRKLQATSDQLAEQARLLDERQAEVERAREELAAERESSPQQRMAIVSPISSVPPPAAHGDEVAAAEADEAVGEFPAITSEEPPAESDSAGDVYERLAALSLLRKEPTLAESADEAAADSIPEAGSESEATAETVAATAADTANSTGLTSEQADDEQSIEDYMAKLLQRVRGIASTAAPSASGANPPAVETSSSKERLTVSGDLITAATGSLPESASGSAGAAGKDHRGSAPALEADPDLAVAQDVSPTDLTPPMEEPAKPNVARRPSPEANLPALRELANLSTQAALDTHARTTLMNEIYVNSTVALTAILFGAVMVCGVAQFGRLALVAGIGCWLVALAFGYRLPMLITRYIRSRDATGDDLDDEDAEKGDEEGSAVAADRGESAR